MFLPLARKFMKVLFNPKNHAPVAIAIVGLVSLLCLPLADTDNYHLVPYLLLFTVSLLATFMSIIPVFIASTLSALIWNFFFIPPHYTFHIEKPDDILLLGMFFMIALLNGVLTSKLRQASELAQKAHFLDESDKLYKTLFNSVSHELRIPVSTIMGATENLSTNNYSPEIVKELTHEVFTASLRLNRVIENLLNMSRLETGRLSVKYDWHDINDLINKVFNEIGEEQNRLNIITSVPDDMPPVWIDFGLIEQVLYNLVFNAMGLTQTTEITISAHYSNKHLVMEITDNGPGFPEDKIGHVFEKFYRIEETGTGGLGLGLSIAKGFVEAHKGTITVENKPKGGAMFVIMIPSPLSMIIT